MQITNQQLQELKDNSTIILDAVKAMNSNDTVLLNYCYGKLASNSFAQNYVYTMYRYITIYIGLDGIMISRDINFFQDVPKPYVIDYIQKKLKKLKTEQNRKAAIKTIVPDKMGYAMLKAHFSSLKKPMSGAHGVEYLKQLSIVRDQDLESDFIDLIWDNTSKSEQFCKKVLDKIQFREKTKKLVHQRYSAHLTPSDADRYIALDISFYQYKIRKYNLMVSSAILTNEHSKVYTYITGVKPTKKLKLGPDLNMAIAKAFVLTQLIQLEPKVADVYKKVRSHIVEHIKTDEKSLETFKQYLQAHIASIKSTKELYGSI